MLIYNRQSPNKTRLSINHFNILGLMIFVAFLHGLRVGYGWPNLPSLFFLSYLHGWPITTIIYYGVGLIQ